ENAAAAAISSSASPAGRGIAPAPTARRSWPGSESGCRCGIRNFASIARPAIPPRRQRCGSIISAASRPTANTSASKVLTPEHASTPDNGGTPWAVAARYRCKSPRLLLASTSSTPSPRSWLAATTAGGVLPDAGYDDQAEARLKSTSAIEFAERWRDARPLRHSRSHRLRRLPAARGLARLRAAQTGSCTGDLAL